MAVIDTGLGWSCEESYLATHKNSDNVYLGYVQSGSTYRGFKLLPSPDDASTPMICAYATERNVYVHPMFITTADSLPVSAMQYVVNYEPNQPYIWDEAHRPDTDDTWCSFDYLGYTWYFFHGGSRAQGGIRNPQEINAFRGLTVNLSGISSWEDKGKFIINQAGVTINPHYWLILRDTESEEKRVHVDCGKNYVLPNKSSESFRGYYLLGWSYTAGIDSAGKPIYKNADYLAEQAVRDLANAGEEIVLWSTFRKAWAYLIGDRSGKLYTVNENGNRVQLQETTLTAELFYSRGCTDPPESEVLVDLSLPTTYRWSYQDDDEKNLRAVVNAVPIVPQRVVMQNKTLRKDIKNITIVSDKNTLYNVSFDGGTTWKMWRNGQWTTVAEDGVGNTKRDLERLNSTAWSAATTQIRFRMWCFDGHRFQSIRIDYED